MCLLLTQVCTCKHGSKKHCSNLAQTCSPRSSSSNLAVCCHCALSTWLQHIEQHSLWSLKQLENLCMSHNEYCNSSTLSA